MDMQCEKTAACHDNKKSFVLKHLRCHDRMDLIQRYLHDNSNTCELAPPAQPPAAATATLGALYQEQGHHEDAERVFRDVIEHEPDNLRARRGLAALAGEPEASLTAPTAWPAGDAEPSDHQRRIGVLREYLARIQRGREFAGP